MMIDLKPVEILFLWRLAVGGGGDWKKEVKPDLDASTRGRLASAGLIETEKRKSPSGRGTPMFISLTEEGWRWLADHPDADLKCTSSAGNAILQRLLGGLGKYLEKTGLSLGDVLPAPSLSSAPAPVSKPAGEHHVDLKDQIVHAYGALTDGQANVRVRIADLRSALPSVPDKTFDEALLAMESAGKASLYRFDNPSEIRHEDRQGVLLTPSGEERHIVYLGGRGS